MNRTEAALLWDPSLDETWDSEVKPEGVKTLGTDQMRWMFFACEKDIHLGRGGRGKGVGGNSSRSVRTRSARRQHPAPVWLSVEILCGRS